MGAEKDLVLLGYPALAEQPSLFTFPVWHHVVSLKVETGRPLKARTSSLGPNGSVSDGYRCQNRDTMWQRSSDLLATQRLHIP